MNLDKQNYFPGTNKMVTDLYYQIRLPLRKDLHIEGFTLSEQQVRSTEYTKL